VDCSSVLALLAAGAAVACTVEGGEEGEPGGSCSVQELEEGKSLLLCDDGTSTSISTSIDSEEGSSCTVSDNGDGTKTLARSGCCRQSRIRLSRTRRAREAERVAVQTANEGGLSDLRRSE
jgi:hypothetical protein